MVSINQSYSVLIPGVTGGDVVKVGTLLNVSNCTPVFPPMDVRFLTDSLITKYDPVAETLAVWDITPPATPTVDGYYAYTIRQILPFVSNPVLPGVPVTAGTNTVQYLVETSAVTGGTKVTLMQALQSGLRVLVNAASGVQVSSSVDGTTGVQTITALAGYPIVQIVNESSAAAPFVTVTNTTPGVASIGTYNDLIRAGVNTAYITTAHTYGFVKLNYQMLLVSGDRTVNLTWTHTLYVDKVSTTNYNNFWTALKTAIGTIFP